MSDQLWIHTLPTWLEWLIIFALGHAPFVILMIIALIGWIMGKLKI